MFLELYGKPLNLCRRQDRCFPCSIWKALKKEYSCIQPCDSICSVCFRDYRMLLLQGSCYCYDAACKSELYFPLWLYHNSVLHQLDQKIIYPHYDFKHLTEKYFEIGMKLDDFLIQLVKYCNCLLENRNRMAEVDLLGSFAYIPELSGLWIYLEDYISDLSNRAWLLQVYRKKGRNNSFTVRTGAPSS